MKTRVLIWCGFITIATHIYAGDLNVVGNMNVASNLTANGITLGGQTRSNWPISVAAGSALTSGVVNTTLSSYYAITLSNHVAWQFQNHAVGRTFTLKVSQGLKLPRHV